MSRPAYTLLASLCLTGERVGRAGGLGNSRVNTAIPSIDERLRLWSFLLPGLTSCSWLRHCLINLQIWGPFDLDGLFLGSESTPVGPSFYLSCPVLSPIPRIVSLLADLETQAAGAMHRLHSSVCSPCLEAQHKLPPPQPLEACHSL